MQVGVVLAVQEMTAILEEDTEFRGIFSASWYMESGTSIMEYYIAVPIANIISDILGGIWRGVKRCLDRKCSCDERKTNKNDQDSYSQMYIYEKFDLGSEYGLIISMVGVGLFFTSTIPGLYAMLVFALFL